MKLHILRKIAKEWIQQIDTKPDERIVHQLNHIKSVDGIDCYIRLHFELSSHTVENDCSSKYTLLLKLTPYIVNDVNDSLLWNYFLYCNHNEHIIINNENDLAYALKTYAKILQNLRFDRLACCFHASINYMIEIEIRNLFSISDTLFSAYEECSVCMEDTLVKTSCNHVVCVPCADKSCYISENSSCPQCRKENALEYLRLDT